MPTATFIVTGATGAIGGAAAQSLANGGSTVVLVTRNEGRAEPVRERVERAGGTAEIAVADLARPESVRAFVASFREAHERLDGLVNCAAVMTRDRTLTPEGVELMFATNHLGPFLLTNLLLPSLETGGPARVLTVSAPSTVAVDLDDLQSERSFRGMRAFGASKTANLLFTFALARRLDPAEVTANALHPGLVKSSLTREMPGPARGVMRLVSAEPAHAGDTIGELMTSPRFAGVTGRFFKGTRPIEPPKVASDEAAQERLWEESARLTGLG